MNLLRTPLILLVLLCFSTALAQDATCEAFVQEAVVAVQTECAPTGRNQACYGYFQLEATPREGIQNLSFAQAGDLANVADLDTLRLSALDSAGNEWGIALMKLQANIPDTLPGQNVTFLLFGNVELQNAVPASADMATVELTPASNVNVRGGPSTDFGVIGSLAGGETATANGRNQDGSWLRIQIPDSSALGWVSASLVTATGDTGALSVVDESDTTAPFKPMQAFYFSTGIGKPSCSAAPQDGIMIQTPAGAGKIELRANDVDIQLGSTAFFQAQPGANMTVSVVDGEGVVTADGESVTVPAGTQVDIPVDEDLRASGPPGEPRPYDPALVLPLPIQLLPEPITIAPPLSEEEIQATNQPPSDGSDGLPADLAAMGQGNICEIMAEEGLTKGETLEALNEMIAMMPAEAQGPLGQVAAMVNACP